MEDLKLKLLQMSQKDEMGRKLRNIPPRFGGKEKMVSGGGKVQQWRPKNVSAEKIELTKIERSDNLGREKSVMIRNIPNQPQNDLMEILDEHCLEVNKDKTIGKSAYDFLYLPMVFKTGGNLGYAFVNFTNSAAATRFFKAFDDYQWDVPVNKKTCKVAMLISREKLHFVIILSTQSSVAAKKTYLFCPGLCKSPAYAITAPPRDGVVSSKVNVIGKFREKPMI